MPSNRPTKERLTALSLRILEDALAQAHRGPVLRTMAHRLALAWLAYEGIGLSWHYEKFWQAMADGYDRQTGEYPHYIRTTILTGLLNHWYQSIGWDVPSHLRRESWSRGRGDMRNAGTTNPNEEARAD